MSERDIPRPPGAQRTPPRPTQLPAEEPADQPGQGTLPPPAQQIPTQEDELAYQARIQRERRMKELDARSRQTPEEKERLRVEGQSIISKTLQNTLPPLRGLGGVGLFGCLTESDPPLDPVDVSDDVAAQYETPEMAELGWVVGGGDPPPPEGGAFSRKEEEEPPRGRATPDDLRSRI